MRYDIYMYVIRRLKVKELVIAQLRHCYCICGRSEKQNGNPTMTAGFPVTFKRARSEYKSPTPKLRQPAQGTFRIPLPLKY